jgi:CheY-like chemotaxis protein
LVTDVRAGRRWDLVLMDLHMPRTDGLTATRQVRELERQREQDPMAIVALTASAFASDVAVCVEAGMNELRPKPVQLEALSALLACHLPS